ncbi:hypothetical protein GASC598P17_005790, partial [Gilliamella apis SCGC AB-598-P17]
NDEFRKSAIRLAKPENAKNMKKKSNPMAKSIFSLVAWAKMVI